MAKATLVGVDVGEGRELLQALDRAGVPVNVALWFFSPEFDDWRFVLASRQFDKLTQFDAYRMVHKGLAASGIDADRTPTLLLLAMSDPFIRELRRYFATTQSVDGLRLGGQLIGDRFIEDAIVYRVR